MKSGSLEHVAENEDSEIKNLRMILHKFEESENDSPQICPNKSISSRKETTSQKRKQAHIFGKLGKVGKGWPRTRLRPARRRDTMLPL